MTAGVILSLFPGIGLLDRAFEEAGFCVVRGPDLLWGGDIRRFNPPAGWAWGVIGGSPCQDFSCARRSPPTGEGLEMLAEFQRVVRAVRPEWWLLENVPRVPDVAIAGYAWQRIDVEQAWFSDVRRLRHIQFGSWTGRRITVARGVTDYAAAPAALVSQGTLEEVRAKQGLPADFDLPGFTREAARRAIGNGVPLPMGRVLAAAVAEAYGVAARSVTDLVVDASRTRPAESDSPDGRESVTHRWAECGCGCGRRVRGPRRKYDSDACRKRAQRRRTRSDVTDAESAADHRGRNVNGDAISSDEQQSKQHCIRSQPASAS